MPEQTVWVEVGNDFSKGIEVVDEEFVTRQLAGGYGARLRVMTVSRLREYTEARERLESLHTEILKHGTRVKLVPVPLHVRPTSPDPLSPEHVACNTSSEDSSSLASSPQSSTLAPASSSAASLAGCSRESDAWRKE